MILVKIPFPFSFQVVHDFASITGCGFKDCDGTKTYVFNYLNKPSGYGDYYSFVEPCFYCRDHCDENNLCGNYSTFFKLALTIIFWHPLGLISRNKTSYVIFIGQQ